MLNLEEEEEEDDVDEWCKSISTVENHGKFNIGWLTMTQLITVFLLAMSYRYIFLKSLLKGKNPLSFLRGGGGCENNNTMKTMKTGQCY